ncbi:MAG: gliding motility-associated C-terminal domain-containing protein [Chitinophagaceae bacterium]|nr:gliding motility-associated C-terminal domain-containing protein [Chitinophagaceae bacterium]
MKKILLPLLLLANVSFAQIDLNLGLRAYYPFSGNANDVSGNNNNPVFNNATLTFDRLGNPNSAYHFDGSSNYIKIPNSATLNSTNTMSISAWVRPTGFYQGQCHGNSIMMKGDADFLTGNYLLRFDDNAFTNGANCSNPVVDELHQNFYAAGVQSPSPGYTPYITVNEWYSVVVTYDGTTARLYVNCVLKNSVAQGGLTFTNSFDLFFGRLNSSQFPYWLNGDLDEVRIYNRALNQAEVNALGGCATTLICNNWLRTQAAGQSVKVGDLDVTGNQVTVEANFNCSSFPISRPDKWEDIVSKHTGTNDANYILRMDLAGINTTNGHYLTPPPCDNLVLNKTYHVAMVYDGSSLKLYRDGYLISQIACTGNLVTNDLLTTIGDYAVNNPVGTNFLGYINEVRIWNVARTQSQLRTYMDISLPNPSTQTGLLGYYTFDNLLNKQGNAAYNGTLTGGATINNTNPNCSFVLDSCTVANPISNIINDYTPITAFDICANKITVEDATKYNPGDTVLMVQMKGAIIDSTNTAGFGTINNYRNAGNYEFNYVKSKAGNIIELRNTVLRQYDIPVGKVQLVRVPYYTDVTVSGTLTCLPWDGKKGGILVLNAANSVDLNADIDVNGRGFIGGQALTNIPGAGMYNQTDYAYPSNLVDGTRKGEGIAEVSENLIFCRGPLASGGGGGNSSNAGGGGGGNGGIGGRGGNEWGGSPIILTNGGLGGNNYVYNSATNKIFMGGAGGSGHGNDATATPGGNGAGIVMINTNTIRPNTGKILANGAQGPDCLNISTCADGVGGGGAGGTIIINAQTISGNFQIQANGGKGADNNINGPNAHGPGGGGAGGALLVNSAALLGNITLNNNGGIAGRAINQGNSNWGALPGNNGLLLPNFNIPFSSTAFRKNIDSVRIKDSLMVCASFDFKGLAYVNTSAVVTWQWSFGDGANASTQNTTHTYSNAGTYMVRLVVTDINGCADTVSKSILIAPFTVDAGNDTTICTVNPVSVTLRASAGASYAWAPAALLNNPAIQNPVATITGSTTFYVTITSATGCVGTDSVRILLVNGPAGIRYPTISALTNQPIQLQARNLGGNSYLWLPPIGLNNNQISNPVFNYNQSQEFIIRIRNVAGCIITDTVLITVKGTKGIYVPRAFSPNANGTNDRLYPILVGISKLNYFRVFNRWGNLVFETNSGNPAAGWDGKVNGFPQPVETYTWMVEGIDIDGLVIRKNGNTFLIR